MKRVLLLGDSIRMGYCEQAAALLDGRAEVLWPNENCRFGSYMLAAMISWAGAIDSPDTIDVVHWNCGQWDMAQFEKNGQPLATVEEYVQTIRRVDALIRKYFPNAQVIFALTTPILPNIHMNAPRTTADVIRYNSAACGVMKELNVPVNDLFSVAQTIPEEAYADAVHFKPEGYQVLAEAVVRAVEQYI